MNDIIFIKDLNDYYAYKALKPAYKYQRKKVKFICSCCNNECTKAFINLTTDFICGSCNSKKSYNQEKIKQTNLKKYGVEHVTQVKEIKEKIKQTCKKHYGVEYPCQSDTVKEKRNQTCLQKYGVEYTSQVNEFKNKKKETYLEHYGVENPSQSKDVLEKRKQTYLEHYGVENPCQSKDVLEKRKQTYLEHYGVENPSQSIEIQEKIKHTNLEKFKKIYKEKYSNLISYDNDTLTFFCNDCGQNFTISKALFACRRENHIKFCTNCHPYNSPISTGEKDLVNYIKTIYSGQLIENDRITLSGKELDIFLPEKKLAFEFDGLYWHNELNKTNNYHLEKTEACEKQGIKLIHIFEDEWNCNPDIVKSRIKSLLNLNEHIFARKCEIKEVNYKDTEKFLGENHIQGNCMSKYRYGLYYNNELISIMTFGKSRFNKTEYEMLRFCNKLNINVIGGASKLFIYFLRKHPEITKIISFADRRWSNGNLYEKLGFILVNKTKPSYYYIINNIRHNRIEFQKHKLITESYDSALSEHEIMLQRKIYRIYDCGNLKYVFINNIK